MAIIKVVKYDGTPDVFAWKYPSQELGTWTQLIVNESQEAILFKEGKALDRFGAGRHTLNTQNIPLLSRLVNLPFGGRSPFTAEVWYVNRVSQLEIKWGTIDPIQVIDPRFRIAVPVRAFGQFGVQVADSRRFLVRLVGTLASFDKEQLSGYFRGLLITNAKDLIAGYLVDKKVSVLEISARLNEISSYIRDRISGSFEEFGVRVLNFFVASINLPEDDPSYGKLRAALADKAEMDIKGFTYQQQRSFDTLEAAAGNQGGGSGLMNAGLGLAMGVGMGGAFGGAFSKMSQGLLTGEGGSPCPKCGAPSPSGARFCLTCGAALAAVAGNAAVQQVVHCDKCGAVIPKESKFCPGCGDAYNPCPACGADNPAEATQCRQCGQQLPRGCAACGAMVPSGARFCPSCAAPQAAV